MPIWRMSFRSSKMKSRGRHLRQPLYSEQCSHPFEHDGGTSVLIRLCLLALEALRLSAWPMELRKTSASASSPKCIVTEDAPFTLWQVERSGLQPLVEPLAGGAFGKSGHVWRANHSTSTQQRRSTLGDLVFPSTHEAEERSWRRLSLGDPTVSEQPSPGACVLLGMLGGGGGGELKKIEMERGSGLLRVTTHLSVPRSNVWRASHIDPCARLWNKLSEMCASPRADGRHQSTHCLWLLWDN